jgi:hypothetical protein
VWYIFYIVQIWYACNTIVNFLYHYIPKIVGDWVFKATVWLNVEVDIAFPTNESK